MKSKKLTLFASALSSFALVAAIIPAGAILSNAFTNKTPTSFSSDIVAVKPGKGTTVSFLPDALSKFYQLEDLLNTYNENASYIGELQQYNTELTSWTYHLSDSEADKEYRRNIFDKYDLFRPTNNILSWKSSINAKGYKVIISQDKSFSTIEREYEVSGSSNSVVFDNPYTSTTYYWQVIATKNDDSKVYSDIFNFTVANLPRTVLIDGVSNTRDLGGNVGLNGKRTKQGLIYRGMGLEAISEKGRTEFLTNLGIKSEIDLRNIGEGTENYLGLDSNHYFHCPAPYIYSATPNTKDYINYFESDTLVPSFGNAIKALANPNNYPIYFHCAVGRDRTGWLGICINWLCGVNEEAVLKDFVLSLFSTSGAHTKGCLDFYQRYNALRGYINDNYEGENLSEKLEDYLVKKAGVTHEEINNLRGIFLGDIETGFVPGKGNTDSYSDLCKVTFRKYGQSPIIKMVEVGSKISNPTPSETGIWYNGLTPWDFENDLVNEDIVLDYVEVNKSKVFISYSGINLPDQVIEMNNGTSLDFSIFEKDGYTFSVYDECYNKIESLIVDGDTFINVVYIPSSGFIPKTNSRIIVMAGQSNAQGVGHFPYLEESLTAEKVQEIRDGYNNVLICGHNAGTDTYKFRKVYADEKYDTAATPGTFGFEVSLADRLSKVFPDETTYIVKVAYGGTSLNHDWISPSGRDAAPASELDNGFPRGWLWDKLDEHLHNAINIISDTTNTVPMVEAFMWMQGESDATLESTTSLYLSSFNALMHDFETTFKDNISSKYAVYDGAISETSVWQYSKQMNAIKRSRVDERNFYIDTNARITTCFEPYGYVTDNAHYDAACYIDLGHMFADAYLTHTLEGYTYNKLEIEGPEKITLTMGQNFALSDIKVYFNEELVEAKLSYFAEQHKKISGDVYEYFDIDKEHGILMPNKVGDSRLRISAYYHDEVRTIIIPVEILPA